MTVMTEPERTASQQAEGERRHRRWAWIIAGVTMLITLIPYLIGASLADGRVFMWLGYNLDDSCVYLSWMRQAANGAYRALNLFTTEPQHGTTLNPLFLVMGRFAGVTGLPLLAVYHLSRMLFGFGLLALVWEFLRLVVADRQARRLAFLFVCFSSGLGWLPIWWDVNPIQTPVDKWQPEAITFLSLYLSPLFLFSMALQVGMVALLFQGERTGKARFAVFAGLCGFVLGLVHSYDIITMTAIWLAYLLVQTAVSLLRGSAGSRSETFNKPQALSLSQLGQSWLRAILAGLLTFPSVLYVYNELRTEAVFRARANVPTLSPALIWVLLGYGCTLLLAIVGIAALYRFAQHPDSSTELPEALEPDGPESSPDSEPQVWTTGMDASRLLIVWAIVNIAVSYLPHTPFQRKMLQGTHFPIALLAGIGAAWLLQQPTLQRRRVSFTFAAIVLTVFLSLTNIRFVLRDLADYTANTTQTRMHRPYLQPGEIKALDWIAANTPADAAVQPLIWVGSAGEHKILPSDATLACFTPGLTGRHVYCGHWGETPDYGAKLHELMRLVLGNTLDSERIALLKRMKVRYLIFSQKAPADPIADSLMPMFRGLSPLPWYLTHVYPDPTRGEVNADADIYEVNPTVLSASVIQPGE